MELHKATGEARWVGVAMQAATYCETWTYACKIPIPPNDPQRAYPTSRTRLGISLIATGQSGAENFMTSTVYDCYRL